MVIMTSHVKRRVVHIHVCGNPDWRNPQMFPKNNQVASIRIVRQALEMEFGDV